MCNARVKFLCDRISGAVSRPRPAYPIASVDRAVRLLLLVHRRSRVRLSEASEALGVAPSTAHRLLAMLVFHDLVRQEDRHAYVPGPALATIARATISETDLRLLARPIVQRLASATDETVHLAVLEGRMVRYLDGVESTRALRMAARTGRTVPAHYVARMTRRSLRTVTEPRCPLPAEAAEWPVPTRPSTACSRREIGPNPDGPARTSSKRTPIASYVRAARSSGDSSRASASSAVAAIRASYMAPPI